MYISSCCVAPKAVAPKAVAPKAMACLELENHPIFSAQQENGMECCVIRADVLFSQMPKAIPLCSYDLDAWLAPLNGTLDSCLTTC